MSMATQVEVYVNESETDGVETVAVLIHDASIIEYNGELVPAFTMSAGQARNMARALVECASRIER